jgi:phage FluMu protein Com
MPEIRCKKCGRLLMKGVVVAVEIKCPKCKYINVIKQSTNPKNMLTSGIK